MTRRQSLIFLTFLSACTKRQRNLQALYPGQVGGWTLEQTRAVAKEEMPELFRSNGFRQGISASYRGPSGRITARILEYSTEPEAFELVQKFHQEKTMAFYKGPLFVLLQAVEGDGSGMQEFAREFRDRLTV